MRVNFMEFEINRDKINQFKRLSNYKKARLLNYTSMAIWGRWIKDKISPTIRSIECHALSSTYPGGLNPAEVAIAILELRQEYKNEQR